jgi:peptide deformylase
VIEAAEGEQDDDGEEGCLSIPGLFTRVHGRSS